jgi:hypothetical protein
MNKKANIPLEKSDSKLLVCSTEIAEHLGIENKVVVKMVNRCLEILPDFERVTFETQPYKSSGGIQNIKICLLNHHQATFIMILLTKLAE